jgi:hypothetical protein
VSGSFKEHWIVERTKRHALYYMLTSVSSDFKYEAINLQQPWEHYWEMVKLMDADYKEALLNNPDKFPVDEADPSSLGSYLTAGFKYDDLGRDLTYKK